jgi:hypothetical protein
VVVANLKVLSQNLPGRSAENHNHLRIWVHESRLEGHASRIQSGGANYGLDTFRALTVTVMKIQTA